MSAQYQLLTVRAGVQHLVSFHCSKVGIDRRCYENYITFFSLVPGGQGKKSHFLNVYFWFFELG